MKKSIDVKLNGRYIEVKFNKELKNHIIVMIFEIVNPYQMICSSLTIENRNDYELSSTDIRKLNTHTLIKRALKAIYSYKNIDEKEFNKNTKGYLKDNLNYKKLIKDLNEKKIRDRNLLLSIYAYIYQHFLDIL